MVYKSSNSTMLCSVNLQRVQAKINSQTKVSHFIYPFCVGSLNIKTNRASYNLN